MYYILLKQISCDEFQIDGHPRGPINFKKGLNVVLGGKSGTNSIGKSTFLMILDFVFGGTDYITKDSDVQKNVGQHSVKFIFEFKGKNYYFSRSTKDFKNINVCDKNFKPLKGKCMTLDKYLDFLLKQYNLDKLGLTFRNAVGRFIRVYNRQTVDEKRPLQNVAQEPGKKQVYSLLKLFDKYSSIEERENANEEAKRAYKVFTNASKYIPIVSSKKQYKENLKRINDLDQQLKNLEIQNDNGVLTLDDIQLSKLRKIQNDLSQLQELKNTYINRLSIINSNEESGVKRYKNDYHELIRFFPDVNIQKIEEIDSFHHQVTKFLELEFQKEKDNLERNIEYIDQQSSRLIKEVRDIKKQQAPNVQTALLNEYADIKMELNKLEDENKNFDEKNRLNQNKKDQKEALDATVNNELIEVQDSLNTKMQELNEKVCKSKLFQPPHIELKPNGYSFETINDQGTGTSYKGLILFDQACLELTNLPFFIHDSLLFSNIELDRKNRIIEMYERETKQIFISIDTIDLLSKQVQQIIKNDTILKLERGGKELFGRSWNEQENK